MVKEKLASFCVAAEEAEQALRRVTSGNAMEPDNISAWVVKEVAPLLAPAATEIFNSSLRGVVPIEWKSDLVIPLHRKHPPKAIETGLRTVSLTPILSKVHEYIGWGWIDDKVLAAIDSNQFGALKGTDTMDALCCTTGTLHLIVQVL